MVSSLASETPVSSARRLRLRPRRRRLRHLLSLLPCLLSRCITALWGPTAPLCPRLRGERLGEVGGAAKIDAPSQPPGPPLPGPLPPQARAEREKGSHARIIARRAIAPHRPVPREPSAFTARSGAACAPHPLPAQPAVLSLAGRQRPREFKPGCGAVALHRCGRNPAASAPRRYWPSRAAPTVAQPRPA